MQPTPVHITLPSLPNRNLHPEMLNQRVTEFQAIRKEKEISIFE